MFGDKMLYQSTDRDAIRILQDFLPDKIFDAHAHLSDYRPMGHALILDFDTYQAEMQPLLCNPKQLRLNVIPFPFKAMADLSAGWLEKSDHFLTTQLDKDPSLVGQIIVHPKQTAQDLENRLIHPGIRGFKCYHVLSDRPTTWHADIGEYLPESAWEVANKHKMVITLHMVKDHALADPQNLSYIRQMSRKYPDATLILAHAARAFASWTGVETVKHIADCENVWFDFSAVCESPAMVQIINKAGIHRCMWGSDYPVCRGRGKAISLANGFYWIYQKDLEHFPPDTPNWLIGLENLMAIRQACILAELNEDRIEDLFYNNAARLWDNK